MHVEFRDGAKTVDGKDVAIVLCVINPDPYQTIEREATDEDKHLYKSAYNEFLASKKAPAAAVVAEPKEEKAPKKGIFKKK